MAEVAGRAGGTASTIKYNGNNSCVLDPALSCENREMPDAELSKIVKAIDGVDELESYRALRDSLDPKSEFTITPPVSCMPDLTSEVIEKIKGCTEMGLNRYDTRRHDIWKFRKLDPSDKKTFSNKTFTMLQMRNEGVDLNVFVANVLATAKAEAAAASTDSASTDADTTANQKMLTFWKCATNYFRGLVMLNSNDIIHHDLKPANLLYHEDTGKASIIDFGLSRSRKYLLEQANIDTVEYSVNQCFSWIYFAPETTLHNRAVYTEVIANEKNFYYIPIDEDYLLAHYVNKSFTELIEQIPRIRRRESINKTWDREFQSVAQLTEKLYSFIKTERKIYKTNPELNVCFDNFMKRSLDTFDVYGLGFALLTVLNKTSFLITPEFEASLRPLFYSMLSFSCLNRPTPEEAFDRYVEIMKSHTLNFDETLYSLSFDPSTFSAQSAEESSSTTTDGGGKVGGSTTIAEESSSTSGDGGGKVVGSTTIAEDSSSTTTDGGVKVNKKGFLNPFRNKPKTDNFPHTTTNAPPPPPQAGGSKRSHRRKKSNKRTKRRRRTNKRTRALLKK